MSVEEQLTQWVEEVVELRHRSAGDPEGPLPEHPGFTADEIINTLTRVRQRQDRIEEILTRIRRVKGRLGRQLEDARFDADIKRDEAYQENRATRVMEFVTADERRADAALASIQEKRAAQAAKRLADLADEAYHVTDLARWGLSAYRQDLRSILHAMQVVNSQEYSGRGQSNG